MITPDHIDRLGLVGSVGQHGRSFMYNLKIYEWPGFGDAKVYVMECDIRGEPNKRNMLTILCKNKGQSESFEVTPDALLDCPERVKSICEKIKINIV